MRKLKQTIFGMLIVLSVSGLSNVTLRDIEVAIIRNNYPHAENLARKFISQNPQKYESDEAHYYLGLSLLYTGKHDQAREVLQKLLQYEPEPKLRDQAYLGIIDSYYIGGHYPEAIEAIEEFLKISPKSAFESVAYLKLARANLKQAKWDEAQKYLNKIITSFPESLEVHVAQQLLDEKQYFSVQIGAFIARDRAEQLMKELTGKGEYAYIVETTDLVGRRFYRVRVGQMTQLTEAGNLKKRLASLGYPTEIYP